MNRDKFHIEMPEERKIQSEINHILDRGLSPKESFLSFLKSMYQQVGIRHLFADRLELLFILFSVTSVVILLFIVPDPSFAKEQKIYSLIFLVSPTLFIAFAIYTYATKMVNGTYEVEMSCKFNVYQVIAFRMLAFSVVSIFVNTITIALIIARFQDISFMRAMMISITALFVFSIIFLFAMMKRHSMKAVLTTILGWTLINLSLRIADNEIYRDVLVNMPLVIHAIVLVISLCFYAIYLKKLIHFKQAEGAY